jgi:hypothetical protein
MTARIVILLCILALLGAMLACDWDLDDGADRSDTGQTAGEAIEATATYGAQEFHLQLTALAETEEP